MNQRSRGRRIVCSQNKRRRGRPIVCCQSPRRGGRQIMCQNQRRRDCQNVCSLNQRRRMRSWNMMCSRSKRWNLQGGQGTFTLCLGNHEGILHPSLSSLG